MTTKKRHPLVAALLTSVTLGMGQVYNGQAKKGILFFLAINALLVILFRTALAQHFKGFLICWGVVLTGILLILTDAIVGARKAKEIRLRPYNKWYVYLLPTFIWLIGSAAVEAVTHQSLDQHFVGLESFRMPGQSMKPTLVLGDRCVVDLNAYRSKPLQRGDIVVFPFPPDSSITFIKRAVALGGDVLEVKSQRLYINQQPVVEPYLDEKANSSEDGYGDFGPLTVPAGKTFVLGDNRANSSDSREWGFVDAETILGRPLFIFWSDDRDRIGIEIQRWSKGAASP